MTALPDQPKVAAPLRFDPDPARFRQVLGHFGTGVTVITTADAAGPAGFACQSFAALSLDPPLILVCFDRASLTLEAIRHHGAFVVNVLAAPQQELSANFARRGVEAAWEGVEHRPGPTGSPRLEGALATLECTVEHSLPGGDHEIIIGRLRYAETSSDDATPLLFWRGSYISLDDA